MASKRIRYSKLNETTLKSVKSFTHENNGARYDVVLNLSENQWMVRDSGTELVAASGHNVSLHKMKLEAKKALVELGITFEKEERIVEDKYAGDSPVVNQ